MKLIALRRIAKHIQIGDVFEPMREKDAKLLVALKFAMPAPDLPPAPPAPLGPTRDDDEPPLQARRRRRDAATDV